MLITWIKLYQIETIIFSPEGVKTKLKNCTFQGALGEQVKLHTFLWNVSWVFPLNHLLLIEYKAAIVLAQCNLLETMPSKKKKKKKLWMRTDQISTIDKPRLLLLIWPVTNYLYNLYY